MRSKTTWLSVAVMAALGVLIVGPAPGEIGGCGEGFDTANAEDFCLEKETWLCARRHARGDFDDAQLQDCVNRVDTELCGAGTAWPPSCLPQPTTLRTRRCIDAISSTARLDEEERDIQECWASVLCGQEPTPPAPLPDPDPDPMEDAGVMDADPSDADPSDAGMDDAGMDGGAP